VNDLKLPFVNRPSDLQEGDETENHSEAEALPLVETLFEWVGIFEDGKTRYHPSDSEMKDPHFVIRSNEYTIFSRRRKCR